MTTPDPRPPRLGLPDLGVGIGLRVPHYPAIFDTYPAIDWFEIISENFMVAGGLPIANLNRILDRYRVVQHGVSLSIGSTAPLDWDYLTNSRRSFKKFNRPGSATIYAGRAPPPPTCMTSCRCPIPKRPSSMSQPGPAPCRISSRCGS